MIEGSDTSWLTIRLAQVEQRVNNLNNTIHILTEIVANLKEVCEDILDEQNKTKNTR